MEHEPSPRSTTTDPIEIAENSGATDLNGLIPLVYEELPPAGKGQWQVTLDVLARKVVVDTTGAETEVPMNDLVEVGVYRAGGTSSRGIELYRALHRIRGGSQKITVLVGAKPVAGGIDPRNLLIDADPLDNMKGIP